MLLRPLCHDHDKKVYFFISALLHSLHRDDEKTLLFPLLVIPTTFTASWLSQKNIFPVANTFTTPWSWQKYMFSFQHYVYYILIMTKNILFSFQFYALWSYSCKKIIALLLLRLLHWSWQFFFFVAATFTTPWLALHPLRPD